MSKQDVCKRFPRGDSEILQWSWVDLAIRRHGRFLRFMAEPYFIRYESADESAPAMPTKDAWIKLRRRTRVFDAWVGKVRRIRALGAPDEDAFGDAELETSPADLPKPRADTASTALASSSSLPASSGVAEDVIWEGLAFAQDLGPYRSYASCAEDVHLISSFLELTPLTRVVPSVVKLLFRVVRFLRMCDYHVEDVCVILAHASAYFLDFYAQLGARVEDGEEVGYVVGSLIFIAHSFVQDETCPLNVWHKHLFRKYCNVKTLNAAIMQLMKLRAGGGTSDAVWPLHAPAVPSKESCEGQYRLRLTEEDLARRMSRLRESIARFDNLEAEFNRPLLGRIGADVGASFGGRGRTAKPSQWRRLPLRRPGWIVQAGQILQLDVFPLRAPGWGLRLRTLCIAPPAPRGLDGAEKRGLGGWILVPHLLWRVPPSRPCFIFASFFQLEPRVVRGYRLSEGFAGTFGWCCSAFAFLWSFSHAEDKLLRS
ncbi:unnamed protein product [Durusdinium trenchii]|uniref:Cyclin N-terminal domain-containing protein n=1 Tax=Durusdinium trenchii TaxID=1381693 RepID=A0ABP0R7E6_9DINO